MPSGPPKKPQAPTGVTISKKPGVGSRQIRAILLPENEAVDILRALGEAGRKPATERLADVAQEMGVLVLVFGLLEPIFEYFVRTTQGFGGVAKMPSWFWGTILGLGMSLVLTSFFIGRRRTP